MRHSRILGALLLVALVGQCDPNGALAVEPDEILADPALEARALQISRSLRCVVCQNQTIDDSNAPLARDLRVLLRERIAAGDSDDAAVAYLVDRYGAFILLRPPLRWDVALLWAGPVLVLIAAAAGFSTRRRGGGKGPGGMPEEEREPVHSLINSKESR
ncbi:MAG: cytochrome c-type biogenesis protein [Paracoccaceae bacterium]